MKFLLDESADLRLTSYLLALGHDVRVVARDYGQGFPDPEVLAIAHREQRILLACDLDFGELIVRYQHRHAGAIILRLDPTNIPLNRARLKYVLTHHAHQLDRLLIV